MDRLETQTQTRKIGEVKDLHSSMDRLETDTLAYFYQTSLKFTFQYG